MAKDYYKILGITKKADEKEIKSAYRKLARKYHPDVNPDNLEAEKKFKEITEAYDVLRDAEKRKMYDQFGENWEQASRAGADYSQYSQGGGDPFSGYRTSGHAGGFEDIFEQLFKGQSARVSAPRPQIPPQDVEQSIVITLEELDKGTKRKLTYQVHDVCSQCHGAGHVATSKMGFAQCPQCRGSGTVVNTRKVEVSIPAGMPEGKKLRIPGGGAKGSNGKAGDLYLLVQSSPHSLFKRVGEDLAIELPVDYLTAILGGELSVPTLTRKGSMKVPAGTQSGSKFRLKGKGISKSKSEKGDLIVTLVVSVPKKISTQEEKLLQELKNLREAKV